jgi:peptidoglycan/LPS O-acetylase OafA/YrhL
MSDQPPPPPSLLPPDPPKGRGLGWFFAVSGAVVLVLTLGCVLAVTGGDLFGEMGGVAVVCGSPTFILGAVFLWLGTRRLKKP